jgi:hypothetical protein
MKMNYWKIFLMVTGVTAVFWVGAAIVSKWFGLIITDTNIALTFLGVLATFVVISNYAQVAEIKREFNNNLQEQKNWHSQEVKEIAENLKEDIETQKKALTEEITKETTNLRNESLGMLALMAAIDVQQRSPSNAFLLFFHALDFFLNLGSSILAKDCIDKLNCLIDNKRVQSLKLYKNRKMK